MTDGGDFEGSQVRKRDRVIGRGMGKNGCDGEGGGKGNGED